MTFTLKLLIQNHPVFLNLLNNHRVMKLNQRSGIQQGKESDYLRMESTRLIFQCEPTTVEEVTNCPNSTECIKAMESEIQSLNRKESCWQ